MKPLFYGRCTRKRGKGRILKVGGWGGSGEGRVAWGEGGGVGVRGHN